MSLTINDALTRKVQAISSDITLAAAARLMSEKRISCLVAVESDKPVGILTEADLVQVAHHHIDPNQTCVSEFLSAPVISIEKNQSIYDAFELLLKHRVRHLIVVYPDGRLKGLLTYTDILNAAEFDDFLRTKPVSDVMNRHVVSALPEVALMEVLTQMDEMHISCMVAVEDAKACGIFTERDATRLLASGADIDVLTLSDAMTAPLVTIQDGSSLIDAAMLMRKNRFRRLVIVDDAQLPVGIVTQFDVIRGLEGKTIHYFRSLYDQMEDQLLTEQSKLERIVDASPGVLYRCEWRGEDEGFVATYVSASITAMFGFDRQECLQPGWWFSHVHPDDQRQVAGSMQPLQEQGELEHTYRFADKSGAYHWLRDHVRLNRGVDGKPDELIGSWLNITEDRTAEQRIIESEEVYRSLVEQSFDGIVILAADGTIVFANAACANAWGGKPDEIIGQSYTDIVHSDELKTMQLNFWQRMDGDGPKKPYETRLIRKNGDVAWVEISGRLITWQNQPSDLLTLHDITERKQREQELLRMRTIVDQAEDCIYATDLDGRYILLNQASERLLKRSREQLIGQPFAPYLAPEHLEMARDMMQRKLNGGMDHSSYEVEIIDAEGGHHSMENNSSLVIDSAGQAIAVQGVLRDITERKRKDELLARKKRQLAVLAEAGKTLNETLDAQQIARKLLTLASEMVVCESGAVGFYHDDKMCFREYMKSGQIIAVKLDFPSGYGVPGHLIYTRKPYISHNALRDEYVVPDIQQEFGFIRLVNVPILDAESKLLGCFEMYDRLDGQDFDEQDVEMLLSLSGIVAVALVNAQLLDEQRRNRLELEQAASRMRKVLDAGFDAVIVHQDFKVAFANAAALKMFSFAGEQQALGVDVIDFVDERFKRLATRVGKKAVRANKTFGLLEIRAMDPIHSRSFPIEIATTPILWHGHRAAVSIIRDISLRKQAEEELRLLESAVASVNESIVVTDPDGTIVYVNPSFTRNTGFEADYAIGKTPAILNSKQQSKAFYQQFWDTISHGKPWTGRILDRRKDGTIFPVNLSVAPIFDAQGEITHYVALHEDLTQAESFQKKLMQAQKMEAVGTMVGGVAHDFNNMLAGIVGNFYMIRRQHPDDEKLLKRIQTMEDATGHGANLIRQMLTFARKDHPEMNSLQLSSFIKEAHKLADAAMPENIRFSLNISNAGDVCVRADATQMQQVLLNLITNARYAVEDVPDESRQGKIQIEVDCSQPPMQLLRDNPEMITDGDWCCIRCVDNGCGIKADNLEHVFEPFFTTKGVGKGTGLGLAMVYGAVHNHRGLIDIASAPDEGTTISIWLPQYREKAAVVVANQTMYVDGGGRLILLVDDEESLRHVLVEVLQQNGFSVLQACDGVQAVDIFKANSNVVAAVVMDVVMPSKGGVIAAKEIREMNADVPIIFQTGYGEQTQLDAAGSIANSDALQKPVHIPEMLDMIMSLLRH